MYSVMQDLVVLPVPKQGFVTGFGSPIPQHRLETELPDLRQGQRFVVGHVHTKLW